MRKCESNDSNRKVCVREDFSTLRNCHQKRDKQKTNSVERFYTTCDCHFDKQKQKNPFVKESPCQIGFNFKSKSILSFRLSTKPCKSRTSFAKYFLDKMKKPQPNNLTLSN